MKMVEWKNSIMRSPQRGALPLMTHPGISLIGRTVQEAVTDPECHSEAVKAVAARYPTAAATTIMDLSVEAEAFGATVRFEEADVPSIVGRTVATPEDVSALAIPDFHQGRLSQRIAATRLAAKSISDRPVFAGCIGPLSLAGRLYDVGEIMTSIYTEPDTVSTLLATCTRFLSALCSEFKAAGANGVVIAEPVAGMLPAELCTEFSSRFIQTVVQDVQETSFMVILHNCGETDPLIASMHGTGAAGLHFGNKCTIVAALETLPSDVLVLGNIDPVAVLKMGTPEVVYHETLHLLRSTARFRNFLLSSGCDVPPYTPLENVDAFFQALVDFNAQT